MNSCLVQLKHAETLPAEVVKDLEEFLWVPNISHPTSATPAKRSYPRLSLRSFAAI